MISSVLKHAIYMFRKLAREVEDQLIQDEIQHPRAAGKEKTRVVVVVGFGCLSSFVCLVSWLLVSMLESQPIDHKSTDQGFEMLMNSTMITFWFGAGVYRPKMP